MVHLFSVVCQVASLVLKYTKLTDQPFNNCFVVYLLIRQRELSKFPPFRLTNSAFNEIFPFKGFISEINMAINRYSHIEDFIPVRLKNQIETTRQAVLNQLEKLDEVWK